MRAVAYARVSSKAQAERQTIESQLRAIGEFIHQRGWDLARPIRSYVDDGRTAKSGHLEKRDGFAALARDAQAGAFDVVVVFDLDRLTRAEDQIERGQILGVFNRAAVRVALVSSGQVLDLRTWEGDLYSSFQAVAAADWLRKHRERILAGKLRAIAEGRKPAGSTPFGYSYDRRAGWSIHEDNAKVVREVFERIAAGETCQKVADAFHESGLKRQRSADWTSERIYFIVTSETYLGRWVADRRKGLSMPVPRIIGDELWHQARTQLKRHRRSGLRRTRHVYLLEQMAVCALCGARISVASHGGMDGQYPRAATYVCHRRRRPERGEARCELPHQKVAMIDERLWGGLRQILERDDVLERAVAQRAAENDADRRSWASDLKEVRGRLERLQATEETILARFRRGLVSEAAMDTELAAAARERAMLDRQLSTARRAGDSVRQASEEGVMREHVDVLKRALRSRSLPRRRELVVALLGQAPVIVSAADIRAMVRVQFRSAAGVRARVGQQYAAGLSAQHEANASDYIELELVA